MFWARTVARQPGSDALLTRSREEDGFTLIELVMTVAIVGIVVTALVGVVFGYLRVSNETNTRLNESTDQQFVSAYWQQDVSSLGVRTVPTNGDVPGSQSVWIGSAPGCTPASGSPIVMFSWNDYKNAPTADPTTTWTNASPNEATYYTKTVSNPNGSIQTQLWRKRCGDTTNDIVVARSLTGNPTVLCYDASGGHASCAASSPFPATVTLTLSVQDLSQAVHTSTGYTSLTLTGERRQG